LTIGAATIAILSISVITDLARIKDTIATNGQGLQSALQPSPLTLFPSSQASPDP